MLDRLVAAFVAPVAEEPRSLGEWLAPEPPGPPSLAVLAPPDLAWAAGGAIALAAAKGRVVVAVWGDVPRPPSAPATPHAKRLATKLTDRGHDATATGRLVQVVLEGPDEAARVAVAVDVATVLVIAGPRDDSVDRVLLHHDRVVVIGDGLVAELATASIRALGVHVSSLHLDDAAVARTLAATGLALVSPWRPAVEEALG